MTLVNKGYLFPGSRWNIDDLTCPLNCRRFGAPLRILRTRSPFHSCITPMLYSFNLGGHGVQSYAKSSKNTTGPRSSDSDCKFFNVPRRRLITNNSHGQVSGTNFREMYKCFSGIFLTNSSVRVTSVPLDSQKDEWRWMCGYNILVRQLMGTI